jgi:hypothetical protein
MWHFEGFHLVPSCQQILYSQIVLVLYYVTEVYNKTTIILALASLV